MKKALVFFLLAAVALSYGQEKGPNVRPDSKVTEKEEWSAPQGRQENDARENLEAQIIAKIKNGLELTPEQAGKFVENYYKTEDLKKEYAKKKMDALMALKKALDSEAADEKTLNPLIENCGKLDKEQQEKMKESKYKFR